MTFLRKSDPLAAVWIKSLTTPAQCSFCSGSWSHGTNFATTHFMPRSCSKILDTIVFGIPRSSSSSHTVSCWSLLIAARTCSTFSGVWHFQQIPNHLWKVFVPHFHLCCTHCIISESLLNHPNSFCRGMFKLNTKFDTNSLLCSLSNFKCNGHTVHMLTQRCLPPSLTSTVKSALFMHTHSSPLSLAARMSYKAFSLYQQWLDFFQTDFVYKIYLLQNWQLQLKLQQFNQTGVELLWLLQDTRTQQKWPKEKN